MRTTHRIAVAAVLGLWFAAWGPVYAQVDVGAGLDVEYRMGGDDSRFILNEMPTAADVPQSGSPDPHFALRQLNLFLFSELGSSFFFEGRVQVDNIGSGGLNPPRIGLAYLGWAPQDRSVSLSVGRFVTPFGLYPKQSLAFRQNFVAAPLLYGYGVNVTQGLGFWPRAVASTTGYAGWDGPLSTLYRTGYATGGLLSWTLSENTLVWDVALVNNAPASRKSLTGTSTLAAVTRLEFRPAVFWTQGLSFSHGSFMDAHPQNRPLRENVDLSSFRQTLIGTDFKTGYGYFGFEGEVAYTIWSVPGFVNGGFLTDALGDPARYRLTQVGGYLDATFEPPFLPGSYLAVRGERLHFPEAEDPLTGASFEWDDDVTRISTVIGYKIHPRILTKVSFTEQTPFDGSAYSLRVQVTSMF